MKVSLNLVKELVGSDVDLGSVDDVVQKIGAQLGAVEEVIEMAPRYKGVVVAKVVSCEKHPNADKLSVCRIDDGGATTGVERGEDGLVQVVCGAPNVREGLLVAWIPPGATVPVTYDKDPFVLEARELRGVVSNGMLASASELGISDDHSGLLEIGQNEGARPGSPFSQLYGCDDVLIDIENKMFTHRPDCFGVLGVAREIAGIYGHKFSSPDWYLWPSDISVKDNLSLEVVNDIPELVPRFMAIAMSDVEVKSSPIWMQALLTRIGVKSINNVVDVTNYLSYLTAQPLHAYDYDKVAALSDGVPKLVVRKPRSGEAVALLNGKTIEPRADAIMIATDKELIGLGGVMGGTSTEVDGNTKNIIIECANFDMYNIRRTSMHHGLFTDAVTRFTKGQSLLQIPTIIAQAVKMTESLAAAKPASNLIDNKTNLEGVYVVTASIDFINKRLGVELSGQEIANLLLNVEFGVAEDLNVAPPFWRTDIQLPEDVVEEVGRLMGFDKIPTVLPKRSTSPAHIEDTLLLKKSLRGRLAYMGANEVLTYSFIHADIMQKAGQEVDHSFKITNALSPDLQRYRMSLTPNLLAHVHQNIKQGHASFALYEIGKVHSNTELDENKLPKELGRVSLVVADKSSKQEAFYGARAYVDELCYGQVKYRPANSDEYKDNQLFQQMLAPYELSRSALVFDSSDKLVGVVGEFKMSVIKAFKLPQYCAGFELFLNSLSNISAPGYVPLSVYPHISQDVCYAVAQQTSYSQLYSSLEDSIASEQLDISIDVELIDIYQNETEKRITFRMVMTSYVQTLTDEQVSSVLDKIVARVSEQTGARRI